MVGLAPEAFAVRRYELVIVPAGDGGVYLCDDEGNRQWYPSRQAAQAAARGRALET